MNSPWGYLGAYAEKTGWDMHTLLWKVSRVNLMMMMADRPDVKYGQKKDKKAKPTLDQLFGL